MPKAPAPVAPVLRSFVDEFEARIAPLALAEKWDNVGLLIESPRSINYSKLRILTCIDLTNDVVSEAIRKQCNFILAYHPILFQPIQSLSLSSQLPVIRCVDAGINVFVPHTALDSVEGGMNDFLSDIFLSHQASRSPVRTDPVTGAHVGRVVQLRGLLSLSAVFGILKSSLNIPAIRYSCATESADTMIRSVAVCVGSGSSVLKGCDADLYLTGEMSHHDILACRSAGKSVVLLDHSSSERPFLPELAKRVRSMSNVDSVIESESDVEPIQTA